jgi:RNA polymerase sigma factor (sigma-70 family)
MSNDAELIRRYAETHAEDAFAGLVQRHLSLVYFAALRRTDGDAHLAEDVTQTVFITLAHHAVKLRQRPDLAGWLYVATRHAAANAMRTEKRRQAREQAAEILQPDAADGAGEINWNQLGPELDAVVDQLGERDRDAILLRFFENRPFAEIGCLFGVSDDAARMRVDRALDKLRALLVRRGITSTSAALSLALVSQAGAAVPATLAASVNGAVLASFTLGSTGSTAAANLLNLMSTTKVTLCICALGLATLAGTGLAWKYRTDLDTFRAASPSPKEFAQLQEQVQDDRKEMDDLQGQLAAAKIHIAASAAAASTTNSSLAAGTAPAGSGRSTPFGALLAMMDNPRMQKMTSITARFQLDNQYAGLFRSLNLAPEQLDQFKNLLVEKQMAAWDTMSAAQGQGIDWGTNPGGFFRAVAVAEKNVDNQISSLLGADGYNQFEQYAQTVPAVTTTGRLRQALSYTATPLTDAQASGLTQILAQYVPLPITNPFAVLNGDLGVTTLTAEARAQAQGVLLPAQLQALQDQIKQQELLLEVRKQMSAGPK